MQQQGNPWDIQPELEEAQAYQKAYQQASQQVQSQNPRDVTERQSPAVSGTQSGGLLRNLKDAEKQRGLENQKEANQKEEN